MLSMYNAHALSVFRETAHEFLRIQIAKTKLEKALGVVLSFNTTVEINKCSVGYCDNGKWMISGDREDVEAFINILLPHLDESAAARLVA